MSVTRLNIQNDLIELGIDVEQHEAVVDVIQSWAIAALMDSTVADYFISRQENQINNPV